MIVNSVFPMVFREFPVIQDKRKINGMGSINFTPLCTLFSISKLIKFTADPVSRNKVAGLPSIFPGIRDSSLLRFTVTIGSGLFSILLFCLSK